MCWVFKTSIYNTRLMSTGFPSWKNAARFSLPALEGNSSFGSTWICGLEASQDILASIIRSRQLGTVQAGDRRIECIRQLLQRRSDGRVKAVEKRGTELNQELKRKAHGVVALQKGLRVQDAASEVLDIDSDEGVDFASITSGTEMS